VAEPAGAAPLAGRPAPQGSAPGRRIALILSGSHHAGAAARPVL